MSFAARFSHGSQLQPVPRLTGELERLRTALLSASDLFHGMDAGEMKRIAGRLPMATCRQGQLLYEPAETDDALFVLKAGNVRLYRLAPDGRKLVVAVLGPGSIFGEMAAIGQSMTGSFAEAVDDCTVCIMSQVDIEQIMLEHPAVAVQMVRLLSARLREAEDKLEQMAFAPVHRRLARLLLQLARNGEVAGYSHQELADMVGVSRETVSRAIIDLKSAGVIAVDRRCIQILDSGALTAEVTPGH